MFYHLTRIRKITMKKVIQLSSLIILPSIIAGCGGSSSEPSEYYPNQVLFQHIEATAGSNSIRVESKYYSNRDIYLSSNSEQQFFSLNDGEQFKLNADIDKDYDSNYLDVNTTIISNEQLKQNLQSGDDIKVLFERENGTTLVSSANIPNFITFLAPVANSVIDHSDHDLTIEWDITEANANKLYLSGVCLPNNFSNINNFNFDHPQGVAFELTPEQTSITIEANTLFSNHWTPDTDCEVTISLYNKTSGMNDTNFAGGSFRVQTHSTAKFTIKSVPGA